MSEQQKRILEYIREHPRSDGIDIGFALEIPLLACYQDIDDLVRTGFLNRDDNVTPKLVWVRER